MVTVDIPFITITTHPAPSTTLTAGSISGNLSVEANATPSATLSYQWFRNTVNNNTGGSAVNGATSATFTLPSTLTAAGSPYYYYCVVSAPNATSVRSNVATVTVNAQDEEPGIVATKYRFEDGDWWCQDLDEMVSGAVSELTANSFTVKVGSENIVSFTGVYSEDGGIEDGWEWAYLYDSSGKIGIVISYNLVNPTRAVDILIGASIVEQEFSWLVSEEIIIIDDMQDTVNGCSYNP